MKTVIVNSIDDGWSNLRKLIMKAIEQPDEVPDEIDIVVNKYSNGFHAANRYNAVRVRRRIAELKESFREAYPNFTEDIRSYRLDEKSVYISRIDELKKLLEGIDRKTNEINYELLK